MNQGMNTTEETDTFQKQKQNLPVFYRMSSNSNLPDLETPHDLGFPVRPSNMINMGLGIQPQTPQLTKPIVGNNVLRIEPNKEVVQKKKEVLEELALQNLAIQEAKVWVQAVLVFLLCLIVFMRLHQDS